MKIDTKTIAFNAIIAAVYAALTILLAPISYGSIQMRISEIMVFLAFYNKKYIPGLVLGCLIANIPSPLGLWDICFGTFATLVAVIAINKLPNRYLGALAGAIANGLITFATISSTSDCISCTWSFVSSCSPSRVITVTGAKLAFASSPAFL